MKPEVLKIGQISDIHIGDNSRFVQGIDVRGNFIKALNSDSVKDTDLIVLSGDLANENGEEGAYEYIAQVLSSYKKPWSVLPGNHDRLEVMAKYFNLEDKVKEDRCYYYIDMHGHRLVFLDSHQGRVTKTQLEWLKEVSLKAESDVYLFMHYPPCFCGHLFMDTRYYLRNMLEVQETLSQIKNLTHIFAGHYHSPFTVNMGRQVVHVAPSTQMQIDAELPYFSLKSTSPGWQIIKIYNNFAETQVFFE